MENSGFTATPRDERVKILDQLPTGELIQRAQALGHDFSQGAKGTRDEFIAMILDAEQEKGLVSR